MKHTKIRRFAAMLLAMMIGLCPVLAQASEFTPGDMLPTLFEENVAAGREITTTLTADMTKFALADLNVDALSALLRAVELEVRYYDDFGTACVNLALRMGGQEIVSANGRIDAEGGMTMTTSLIPDKTFMIPGALLEQHKGANGPAVQALIDYMPMAYITYFYRLGGWVSNTQMYREDLYVPVEEGTPATDARDEVAQAMHYRVYNVDFLELLESVTFYFRDTDPEFKQHIADALAELGVTRGQLRKVFDTLFTREDLNGPDHWITRTEYLKEHELNAPVEERDIHYAATRMAFSVKTCQEEMIDGVTDFIVSEGTDYQTVGFDGTMPQMWKDFPFENGSFTYNRKTLEGEGVHHTAQGHMDLIASGYAVDGDLDLYLAERKMDDYTNAFDIGMDFVRESDKFGFDANISDRMFIENEADKRELTGTLSVYQDDKVHTAKGMITSETNEIEGDFTNATTLHMQLGSKVEMSMGVKMASGDYEEVVMPEDVVNLETVTQEELDALESTLMAGLTKALYAALGAMPPEAMGLLQ